MEYGRLNSSDDDLPPSYSNRVSRGGQLAGNGRSVVGSMPFHRMRGGDMESQIHQLEQEAYTSVLRAFKAQSDDLSWEKESLITELRKELRVSDDEHRELLTRVSADDTIRRIREWRQAVGHPSTTKPGHDLLPSQTTSFHKKQKTSQSAPISFGMPMQSSPLAAKRGSAFGSGGRRPKPGQPLPGLSSMRSTQLPFTGSHGRGQLTQQTSSIAVLTNEPAEAAIRDPLIGRKVMTRWPDDNTFYEAVIREYNPIEGRHALVYDINTPKETWEWVDLKEISPEDIRWVGEDPGIARQGGLGMVNSLSHGVTPRFGRERGPVEDQFRKESSQLQNGVGREPDEIEILDTETLIKEVEKVVGTSRPDLLEIERAKKMLKEHEQALISVIEKLADESDDESDEDQQITQGQPVIGGSQSHIT